MGIFKPAISLLDFKEDRDATLKLIDWFDIPRIHSARILVVGAGAIGNEVLKNLALLGIGNIYIFDRDTIEMSNLSRAVLYRASDSGQSKAATAARAVQELNPNVNVRWQQGDIERDLGAGFVRRMNVVIGCLDNRDARFRLNRLCLKVGRPWTDAGIGSLNGQARVFSPGHGACYECSFSEGDYRQLKIGLPCDLLASRYASEGKIPTTPTIASIVAAVQVQEALKLLDFERWEGRTLAGREFVFNGTFSETSIIGLPERADCPAHNQHIPPELLVELPDVKAAETTVAELLSKARELLDPTARIHLNFDLVVDKRCPACKQSTPVLRPESNVLREDMVCQLCGHECEPEKCRDHVWELVREHKLGTISEDYTTDILNLTLAAIGVPALDILEASGADGRVLYLELSGDADQLLNPNV
jgi:adenylyltransferase/sulfurtransferase